MIKINKGYIQVNGNYIKIGKDLVNAELCDAFEQTLSQSPSELFNKFQDNPLLKNSVADNILNGEPEEIGKKDDAEPLKSDL